MHRKLAALLLTLAAVVCAQRRVDPKNTYVRVICVVPLVGGGTQADPKRPMYAPWPLPSTPPRTGIIAFAQQISDDGKYALAEFVARDWSAFSAILSDKQVKTFRKGRTTRTTSRRS
ncbi:MAG: hypothetical protein LAQ30_02020 [Acidobacteriia bacterium]|nr:hypothetical protein [Terriglobia bacterium]